MSSTRVHTDTRQGISVRDIGALYNDEMQDAQRYMNSNGDELRFQTGVAGQRGEPGWTNEALIAVLVHRLTHLNSGDLRCRENAIAITKLEEAKLWLDARMADREERGVMGTDRP